MRSLAISTLTLLCAFSAAAQSQFRVEYKLYRTSVPDEERAAKEQTVRSSPQFGIIDGDYINEDAGFSLDGEQVVYRPADSDKEFRYELVSSPSLAVLENEEATLQIGEQVPYQGYEKGEDGESVPVTKYKNVGTTVNTTMSESGDDNVYIKTDGKFVTLVGRKKMAMVDQDGNGFVVPILESTTWESEMTLPLGAWLYQRVKVTQGHEFLIFARVTRFDAAAEAKQEQYSVEMKLVRVPESIVKTVREQFVYDDGVEILGDAAKIFGAQLPGTDDTAELREFLSFLNDERVELLTAPRMTVGNGASLFKLVVNNSRSAKDESGATPGNAVVPGIEQFMELSPVAAQFLQRKGSYLGVIFDGRFIQDPTTDSAQGFEGYQFCVQFDPSANSNDETFGLNLAIHHQFKTGGREKSFFRRAEPYTFGDQVLRFSEFAVTDGGWFGIEFTSKKTGDPMLLFVEVDKLESRFRPPVSTADTVAPQIPARELQTPYTIAAKVLRVPRGRSEALRKSLDVVEGKIKVSSRGPTPFRNFTLVPKGESPFPVTNEGLGGGAGTPSWGNVTADPTLDEYANSLSTVYEAELVSTLESTVAHSNLLRVHTMMPPEQAGGQFIQKAPAADSERGGGFGGISTARLHAYETDLGDPSPTMHSEMRRMLPVFREYVSFARLHGDEDNSAAAVIMDFTGHWTDDKTMAGFDGYVLGVKIDRRQGVPQLHLSGDFHHQFPKADGKEGFADYRFSFTDHWLDGGTWIGFVTDDKATDDTLVVLLSVEETAPDAPPSSTDADAITDAFSRFAIPDDVEVVLDIVPRIDGENVRLQIQFTYMNGARKKDKALAWTNVIVHDDEPVLLGYDFDDPMNAVHVLGASSVTNARYEKSVGNAGNTIYGVAVPGEIDAVVCIAPQIADDAVRLWSIPVRADDLSKQTWASLVWNHVIVRDGEGLVIGCDLDDLDRPSQVLGFRDAISFGQLGGDGLNPYSAEFSLLRIPAEHADAVRDILSYVDGVKPVHGNARAFRARLQATKTGDWFLYTFERFKDRIERFDPEQISVPVPNVVVTSKQPEPIKSGDASPHFDSMIAFSPSMKEYAQVERPYTAGFAQFSPYKDPMVDDADAPIVGFDGTAIGFQMSPPGEYGGANLSFDLFFHRQFKTGEIKDERNKKKIKAYTFGDDIFEFREVPLREGGWIGFEFESNDNGDLMLLLVSVVNVDPNQ